MPEAAARRASRDGPYLRLVRWPGVLTAAADAATAAWLFAPCASVPTFAVVGAAALVYAGGAALNDAADAERDRALHPDRPIPAGLVPRACAARLGVLLLGLGVALAGLAGRGPLLAYAGVAVVAAAYDLLLKRWGPAGALAMGLCRGGSVLGAALIVPEFGERLAAAPGRTLLLPLVWLLHGAAVTAASLLEDSPRRRARLGLAVIGILVPGWLALPLLARWGVNMVLPMLLWVLLAYRVMGALTRARWDDSPTAVGAIVREGVFGFLLLDAIVLAARGHDVAAGVATAVWSSLLWLLRRSRS